MKQIGIVGAGVMGAGIAELFSSHGYHVILVDTSEAILEKARQRIARHGEEFLERIHFTTELDEVKEADLIVEAVIEDVKVKQGLFKQLDALNPGAILASNTSTIKIEVVAEQCRDKKRVIGMHFYNPPTKMELLEIVRTKQTSEETYLAVLELSRTLGKTAVTVKDEYGFIGNRVLMPLINEAIWALHKNIASRDDIDTVFTLGMRHPLGPLALADFMGLDTCLHIMESLHRGLGDDKFKPCPLLVRMVKQGHVGKKSKKGFYDY